jgi:hypothetical protein
MELIPIDVHDDGEDRDDDDAEQPAFEIHRGFPIVDCRLPIAVFTPKLPTLRTYIRLGP